MEHAEMQRPELREAEPQQAEPQQRSVERAEIRKPEPQQAEPQAAQPLQREMDHAEMRRPEPRQEAPEQTEPQQRGVERAEKRQPEPSQAEMQSTAQAERLPRDAKWTIFLEPSFGTRMDLPSAVFSMPDGRARRGVGRQFKTLDGRAAMAVYSLPNKQHDTPARHLRRNFNFQGAVDYERVTSDFFAVSGINEGTIYYSRCNISRPGGTLHCFDVKYPAQENTAWDGIVTRMSRSLRPLNRG